MHIKSACRKPVTDGGDGSHWVFLVYGADEAIIQILRLMLTHASMVKPAFGNWMYSVWFPHMQLCIIVWYLFHCLFRVLAHGCFGFPKELGKVEPFSILWQMLTLDWILHQPCLSYTKWIQEFTLPALGLCWIYLITQGNNYPPCVEISECIERSNTYLWKHLLKHTNTIIYQRHRMNKFYACSLWKATK